MNSKDDFWDDMDALIPKMRKAVRSALTQDIATIDHDLAHQSKERKLIRTSLDFLRKKWILELIYIIDLLKTPFYTDIHNHLPEVNTKTLISRLKELEELEMVNRLVISTQPIRVQYKLTDFGEGIYELILPLLSFYSEKMNRKQRSDQKKPE
ncbi:hypothetical protein NEF87_001087 [Candidatus Lokiarchaeum ossiferum]|uniref:HTH hxlR-type domain-containing protein n=1 Tax=Candidatus Lokiarchaeum ossiferum TaxID=2951803 RepID=A0ABY6HPI0_9ARCH|nr:hypothetical protein NEF87_001087 [Candidatus Lokiarchaeum sp. B-35]